MASQQQLPRQQQQQLAISLPTGPLGVSIQSRKQTNNDDGSSGLCVVTSKSKSSSVATPLEVGDVIVSLNGIKLADVQGGMSAWVKLFQVFGTGERNLIVHRNCSNDNANLGISTNTTATTNADSTIAGMECDFTSQQSIKEHFPYVEGRGRFQPWLSQIDKLETNEAKAQYVRGWRNLTVEQQTRYIGDYRAGVDVPLTFDKYLGASGNVKSTMAVEEEKKHALLEDSVKSDSTKKQKLDIKNERTMVSGKYTSSSEASSSSMNGTTNQVSTTNSKPMSNIEVIDLLDDSDDEATPGGNAATSMTGASSSGSETMQMSTSSSSEFTWRQVLSVSTSSTSSSKPQGNLKDDRNYNTNESGNAAAGATAEEEEDEDEELTIVATKGQNALVDFPHSRANCVSHPFATGDKMLHCDNCYCYVCDIPAKDCKTWTSHCEASHDDPRWRAERERAKRQAREPAPAASSAFASSSAAIVSRSATTSLQTSSAANSNARVTEYSVRSLLQAVTTVHPVEMTPPAGGAFRTPLRHYQKQSLAFMVDTERNLNRGGWLCDEVGMGKSAVILALVATNPPNLRNLSTNQQINQIVHNMNANDRDRAAIKQPYYDQKCREETALMAQTQGMDEERYKEAWDGFRARWDREFTIMRSRVSQLRPRRVDKIKLKTNVVLTSLSLMGQWEDEVKKHAPGLVVKIFHSSRKKRAPETITLRDRKDIMLLSKVDVVISTSTFSWPSEITKYCEFHRVIQDESHLFCKGSSARIDRANELSSKHRWGVTATPMASSVEDLTRQLNFIQGSAPANNAYATLRSSIKSYKRRQARTTFNSLVDSLQTFMIRHTKNQQINGNEALALPPATTSTIMLRMSQEEDRAFNCINATADTLLSHKNSGSKVFTAERFLAPKPQKVLQSGNPKELMESVYQNSWSSRRRYRPERLTKVVALRNDLAEQRRTDPQLRAVVFTQFVDIHDACVRGLQQDGFDCYQFTGAHSSHKRDEAIRSFQNTSSRRPAVFVITIRSGNVGITLTAASRVYLLEPCLDPAVEVQAAGRIHRLGQNKPCHVVKFAFENSYESNILKLHKKILEGKLAIVDGFVPPEAMQILAKGIRLKSVFD